MHLIVGGSGQLGSSFRRLLPNALAPPHNDLDVVDSESVAGYLDKFKPDCVINCSGFTDVDGAETAEVAATAVNGTAVGDLARLCAERAIRLLTFSTDYVFDGQSEAPYVETDPTNPLNAYGRSKEVGERLALRYPDSLIVRASWLFSSTHPNFPTSILRAAAKGEVRVVDDQVGRPTHVDDLAFAALQALDGNVRGLLHLASPPSVSWYEFAVAVCGAAGMGRENVVACSSEDYKTVAERPSCSALTTNRTASIGLGPMPSWLDRMVDMEELLR